MPFGVTNALEIFMDLMHRIFWPYLNKFVVVFIDDILFYAQSLEEYAAHLKLVLENLRVHKLYAKFSKCKFWLVAMSFLRYVIAEEGIMVDLTKVEAISNCKQSKIITEIRRFLGLARFTISL
jgi:hypothetical protein